MKYLLSILLFITLNAPAVAQKIHFGDSTNYWGFLSRREIASQGHIFKTYYTGRHYNGSFKDKGNTYYGLYDYFYRFSYVREDTSAHIIYGRAKQTDTVDYIIFDYNLKVGDTFTAPLLAPYETQYAKCLIKAIDSVKLNGIWHKKYSGYYFQPYPEQIIFIEGIGANTPLVTLTGPFPGDKFPNDVQVSLSCFTNNGNIPMKDTSYLFNCKDSILNIHDNIEQKNEIKIYPQPASSFVYIHLPELIVNGEISIFNQLGQITHKQFIHEKKSIKLENEGNLQGLNYYKITNNTLMKTYTGKLLFR